MRYLRTATPVPRPKFETVCWDISPSRRVSLPSEHLPTLNESSLDCKALRRIIRPAFSTCEQGTTEVTALIGTSSNLKRGQLMKSSLERRRPRNNAKLPNLNTKETLTADTKPVLRSSARTPVLPGCAEDVLYRHDKLTRVFSHPVVSKGSPSSSSSRSSSSKSLPRLTEKTLAQPLYKSSDPSGELRRRIQQEDMEYDFLSSKAIILERFLNSQQVA